MKSYCVRQRKETLCVPRSERITTASNGRKMLVCRCAECGATKTRFIKGQIGGAVGNGDFSCGYNLKGKRAGTVEECFKRGQIRHWGVNKLDEGSLDTLLQSRKSVKNLKSRGRRRTSPKLTLLKRYIPKPQEELTREQIHAIIKKRNEELRTTPSKKAPVKKAPAKAPAKAPTKKKPQTAKKDAYTAAVDKITETKEFKTDDFIIDKKSGDKYTILEKIYLGEDEEDIDFDVLKFNISKAELVKWMRKNIMESEL